LTFELLELYKNTSEKTLLPMILALFWQLLKCTVTTKMVTNSEGVHTLISLLHEKLAQPEKSVKLLILILRVLCDMISNHETVTCRSEFTEWSSSGRDIFDILNEIWNLENRTCQKVISCIVPFLEEDKIDALGKSTRWEIRKWFIELEYFEKFIEAEIITHIQQKLLEENIDPIDRDLEKMAKHFSEFAATKVEKQKKLDQLNIEIENHEQRELMSMFEHMQREDKCPISKLKDKKRERQCTKFNVLTSQAKIHLTKEEKSSMVKESLNIEKTLERILGKSKEP